MPRLGCRRIGGVTWRDPSLCGADASLLVSPVGAGLAGVGGTRGAVPCINLGGHWRERESWGTSRASLGLSWGHEAANGAQSRRHTVPPALVSPPQRCRLHGQCAGLLSPMRAVSQCSRPCVVSWLSCRSQCDWFLVLLEFLRGACWVELPAPPALQLLSLLSGIRTRCWPGLPEHPGLTLLGSAVAGRQQASSTKRQARLYGPG